MHNDSSAGIQLLRFFSIRHFQVSLYQAACAHVSLCFTYDYFAALYAAKYSFSLFVDFVLLISSLLADRCSPMTVTLRYTRAYLRHVRVSYIGDLHFTVLPRHSHPARCIPWAARLQPLACSLTHSAWQLPDQPMASSLSLFPSVFFTDF